MTILTKFLVKIVIKNWMQFQEEITHLFIYFRYNIYPNIASDIFSDLITKLKDF